MSSFLLVLIFLTICGVPVMAGFMTIGWYVLVGLILFLASYGKYVLWALLIYGAWRFFRWYGREAKSTYCDMRAATVTLRDDIEEARKNFIITAAIWCGALPALCVLIYIALGIKYLIQFIH